MVGWGFIIVMDDKQKKKLKEQINKLILQFQIMYNYDPFMCFIQIGLILMTITTIIYAIIGVIDISIKIIDEIITMMVLWV